MPDNERINKKKIYVIGKMGYIWREFEKDGILIVML